MFKRLVPMAIAGYAFWRFTGKHKQRLSTHRSARKPLDETKWEGEGGALPVSGAQLGPEPVIKR